MCDGSAAVVPEVAVLGVRAFHVVVRVVVVVVLDAGVHPPLYEAPHAVQRLILTLSPRPSFLHIGCGR